jgi:hypothetical protein
MVLMKVSLEEEDKGWLGFWKRLVFVDIRSRRSIWLKLQFDLHKTIT